MHHSYTLQKAGNYFNLEKIPVADLSLERPNVYLEVGYAWGLKKPVILVAREGQRLHFDLSHHKCLFYKNISRLSEQLEKHVREMFGVCGEA